MFFSFFSSEHSDIFKFPFSFLVNMPAFSLLPPLRRIVTAHDRQGLATVESDVVLESERIESMPGAQSAAFWVTTDEIPVNDNNVCNDGVKRMIDDFGLVRPSGIDLRSTDLDPGAATPMHRTSSLDYNILISGEVILITEDGTETHLKYPGDTVIQRGTMHAWRNPSETRPARWISVLIVANPPVIDGEALIPQLVPYEPKV